ncbi:MAG: DUF1236 domain-containing protein [Hyphomicrobium sp.]|nr:MAG: DUF1236 domain-containing protein [Hyphomicrobium sp.]
MTLVATLMLSAMGCAYAQGGPDGRMGGPAPGGPGVEGPAGMGGGPDLGGPAAPAERAGPSAGGGGDSPAVEPGPAREATETPPARRSAEGPAGDRGERQRDADDSDRGGDAGNRAKARAEREADEERAKADDTRPSKRAAERAKLDGKPDEDDAQARTKDKVKDAAKQTEDKEDKEAQDSVTGKDADTAAPTDKSERVKQVELSDDKRDRVQSAFRDKTDAKHHTDVDIDISIGRRLPRHWHFVPVPIAVIDIVPEYRDYVYVWVEDEYVICDPDTYEVVAVIPATPRRHAAAGSGGRCSTDIHLSADERELILGSVRLGREVDVADLRVGWSVPSDIELEEFPEPVLSEADELGPCRYFVADDQLAIVDPAEDKVVLLIDKS